MVFGDDALKITKLKDHQLIVYVASVSREYFSKHKDKSADEELIATKREHYAIETLSSISNVIICLDQLHFSVDMLSGFSNNKTHKSMNRYDYILYNIENFYLRLTSIYDRCLRLTNVVYQLGLPERQCNNNTVVKNDHLKNTKIASDLKSLDIFSEPFRFHRNVIAHNATYSEEDLDRLGPLFYVVETDGDFKQYSHFLKRKADNYISIKKDEFNIIINNVEDLVDPFFESIKEQFLFKVESL
jgi:hypothetical protein